MPACGVEGREDGWVLFSAALKTSSLSVTRPGAEENQEGNRSGLVTSSPKH